MNQKEKQELKEKLFQKILEAETGDYAIQAETAATIHPNGW